MKPPKENYSGQNVFRPGQFLKCPECHRTTTVSLILHIDGDFTITCSACNSYAFGRKLHESDRTYGSDSE